MTTSTSFTKYRKEIIASVILLLAFGGGWFLSKEYHDRFSTSSKTIQVRENSQKYRYINPLIYIDNSSVIFPEFNSLQEEMENYISNEVLEGKIENASVYFRNLTTGSWTGVDEDTLYTPASMLKVATLMEYLKLAEDTPGIINTPLTYRKNPNERQNYPPEKNLENGTYPAGELLTQMIIESDNAASIALSTPIEQELESMFKTLRIPVPSGTKQPSMSPRDISVIFRALHSSTYLLATYSEQALDLLTRTTFTKGLVRGVSPEIKVAHKFGEHTVYYEGGAKPPDYELHDCGIIYYPEYPYLLCVMTRGKDLTNLEMVIQKLSQTAFQFVEKI